MILFDNRVGAKITSESLNLLEAIAECVLNSVAGEFSGRNIELLLVSNDEIRTLNAEFLGRDYATDVLSFPLDLSGIELTSDDLHLDSPKLPLGSIVIAYQMADCVAKAQNHSLQTELAILFTHGLLHLLGYDHEADNGEHRIKECEILAHFGIKSLIERNSK